MRPERIDSSAAALLWTQANGLCRRFLWWPISLLGLGFGGVVAACVATGRWPSYDAFPAISFVGVGIGSALAIVSSTREPPVAVAFDAQGMKFRWTTGREVCWSWPLTGQVWTIADYDIKPVPVTLGSAVTGGFTPWIRRGRAFTTYPLTREAVSALLSDLPSGVVDRPSVVRVGSTKRTFHEIRRS